MFPRVFVGIPIPASTARQCVSALPVLPVSTARLTPIRNWHLTIAFLGPCSTAAVEQVTVVLRRVLQPVRSFNAIAQDVQPFPRRDLLAIGFVPQPALDRLAQAVRAAVRTISGHTAIGGHGQTDFLPHVTMARHVRARSANPHPLRTPVVVSVREVRLMASMLGAHGVSYRSLATFRLLPR